MSKPFLTFGAPCIGEAEIAEVVDSLIGIHQIPHVEDWLARRNQIWAQYLAGFSALPIGVPAPDDTCSVHARHLFTLLIDAGQCGIARDEFMQRLYEQGIGTGVHYVGVHLHPYYRDTFGFQPDDFPNATWISERTVSLPLSPALSDDDVARVIDAVHAAIPAS